MKKKKQKPNQKEKVARKKNISSPSPSSLFSKLAPFQRGIAIAFFTGFLLLGLLIFQDYGISWDELTERSSGLISIDYVNEKYDYVLYDQNKRIYPDEDLMTYRDRYYAVLFSMVSFGVEKLFDLIEFRDVFLVRHLLTFLLFWLGTIFFYKMLKLRFKDWKLALLGCLMLIISPRIFADAFYNSKDLILLPCYLISTYTLIQFIRNKTLLTALLHALACGILINARIIGIIIPLLSIGYWLIDLLQSSNIKKELPDAISRLLVFIPFTLAFTVLFWPYLWDAPFTNFIAAFNYMGDFPWHSDMRYWGNTINADNIPWHYIPSWFGITTPVYYVVLILIGLAFIFKRMLESIKKVKLYESDASLIDVIWISISILPVLIIILSRSNIYHGWRHLYFIYPALIGIAVVGFVGIIKWIKKRFPIEKARLGKNIVIGLMGISMLSTTYFMVKNHPLQNVYFNFLAGSGDLSTKFDMDYWGLSVITAYEELLLKDRRDKIKIACYGTMKPCKLNRMFLPDKLKNRIEYVENEAEADYYVSIFLWSDNAKYRAKLPPFDKEFFSIKVDGNKVVGVYKLR